MRLNIIWFDDDLRPRHEGKTIERTRLQVWLRWFAANQEHYRIIEVRTLEHFASLLREQAEQQHDLERRIHAFLIDQMWRQSSEFGETFEKLDPQFRQEKIKHLDAGVKLVALMRNKGTPRPEWMKPFEATPTAIFTSITEFRRAMDNYLDADARESVVGILKMSPDDQEQIISAGRILDDDLVKWLNGLQQKINNGVANS